MALNKILFLVTCLFQMKIRFYAVKDCHPISEFFELNEFEIDPALDLDTLMNSDIHRIRESKQFGFEIIGKGNFSCVVSFKLKDKRLNKSFSVAVKILGKKKINPLMLNAELKKLSLFSKYHPLSSVRYLTCFTNPEYNRVFIMMEKLDYDLSKITSKIRENFTQQQWLEMYLYMTYSLMNLHKMNFAHYDLKLNNWVVKTDHEIMPKIIDLSINAKAVVKFPASALAIATERARHQYPARRDSWGQEPF